MDVATYRVLQRSPGKDDYRPDFAAMPQTFEDLDGGLVVKDGIDVTLDTVDLESIPMNPGHTVGIIPERAVSTKDLNDFPLDVDKKKDLDRGIVELSTILKERHGYTLDVDLAVSTIWNLKKAEFLDGNITAYFSAEGKPVFFLGSSIAVMQAPRIDPE